MNICILNSILYTADNNIIPKVDSIKDCMIYNFALGFKELGHSVTLVAASDYKPINYESYDFEIIFIKSCFKKVFLPTVLPFQIGLISYLYKEKDRFDLIISSEVFSFPSLFSAIISPKKTIIWQELGEHNRKFNKIPSIIWYNFIARLFMQSPLVIPRSRKSMEFIKAYSYNVTNEYIEHGLNIDKFSISNIKKKQLIVVSQLISRKNISSVIVKFNNYVKKYADKETKLIIAGKGDQEVILKNLCNSLKMSDQVIFTGFISHVELFTILSESLALLVDTKRDLNMVTIAEAVACGTAVLTNDVPYSSYYIAEEKLGIVKFEWSEDDIFQIISNNEFYTSNCSMYRQKLSNSYLSNKMVGLYRTHK